MGETTEDEDTRPQTANSGQKQKANREGEKRDKKTCRMKEPIYDEMIVKKDRFNTKYSGINSSDPGTRGQKEYRINSLTFRTLSRLLRPNTWQPLTYPCNSESLYAM